MKEKIIILGACLIFLSGCSKKVTSAVGSSEKKPIKESEKPVVAETTSPAANNTATEKTIPSEESPQADDVAGTYQIISYDDGSGNKQTFEKGKDNSILGSSSIVLNQNGSCEFNLPGMSSDGCTWSGNEINTGGASVAFSVNSTDLTIKEDDGIYVFEK